MEIVNKIVLTIVGVIAASGMASLILFGKWLFSIKGNTDKMIANGTQRACENAVQFQMLRAQGKAIYALSTANKTIIEVTAKKEINGNVEKALGAIAKADKGLEKAEEVYTKFVDDTTCKDYFGEG